MQAQSKPVITSVKPTFGPLAGGTAVTISGSRFAVGTTVRFEGVSASSVKVVSATQITALSPPASAQDLATIQVTNSDPELNKLKNRVDELSKDSIQTCDDCCMTAAGQRNRHGGSAKGHHALAGWRRLCERGLGGCTGHGAEWAIGGPAFSG